MRARAMFPQIELISIGAFLLAASAGTRAIYENYRGSARDSIAAVRQAVTRKTDQCKIIAVSISARTAVVLTIGPCVSK
jgi:hypothetical protein